MKSATLRALPSVVETRILPDAVAAGTVKASSVAVTDAAVAALRGGGVPWPGSAIAWVRVDGAATRLLDETPRAARATPGRRSV